MADIVDRISEDSEQAAEHVFNTIEKSIEIPPRFPMLFRESERMPGTREIPVLGSFLVFYRVGKESIEIIGVANSRRKFPIKKWKDR